MNSIFHSLAPQIALKSPQLQPLAKFLFSDGFSIANLTTIACYPDLVDHDNVRQNAEIHHAHSYKLDANGKWLGGDAMKTIEAISAFSLNAYKEAITKDAVPESPLKWVCKYMLCKVSHYRIDATTYPHLHHGKPWSIHHTPFEDHMGKWLRNNQDKLGNFTFAPYKDVYKDCRKVALISWKYGLEAVNILEAGKPLPENFALMSARCCVQAVGDLWLTLALQMGICK